MVIVYGIPNCDMVKKAIAWLKKNRITYEFHNFQADGISKEKLRAWLNTAGLEVVINKRSTTWRNLGINMQSTITNAATAAEIAVKHTSIIKRPVVESDKGLIIGFNEQEYQHKFAS